MSEEYLNFLSYRLLEMRHKELQVEKQETITLTLLINKSRYNNIRKFAVDAIAHL